jgi:hypothetical protein
MLVIKHPGSDGRVYERMMATTVETMISAVYEDTDGKLKAVRKVMDFLSCSIPGQMLDNKSCTAAEFVVVTSLIICRPAEIFTTQ